LPPPNCICGIAALGDFIYALFFNKKYSNQVAFDLKAPFKVRTLKLENGLEGVRP